MKRTKVIILSLLFLIAYIFVFIQFDNLEWISITISVSAMLSFVILIIIPWDGNIIFILKRLKNNHIMTKLRDEKNYMPEENSKVAVMLSGGVDSAVVAKLLVDQNYQVEAFFMRNWDSTANLELNNILTEDEICQQEEDYNDAKKVADQLNIKLHRVNFVKEYWDYVFEVFLKEIKLGMTPNPDILCNRHIKFDEMIKYIEKNHPEFKYIATGHYAKIIERDNIKLLAQAKDKFKDQTYFLSEINKNILNKIIFPLAELSKKEVRKIAIESNLVVANKKDSTGICFIGKRNFPEFISNYLKDNPGKIVDKESGKIIGSHRGVLFYTIGQRKGLNLGGFEKPYFVSGKDVSRNILFVSSGKDNIDLLTKEIKTKEFNYLISEDLIKNNMKIKFKTRHSELIYDGTIIKLDKGIKVISKTNINAVTPGQELVVYFNGICIGGGQII